MNYKIILDEDKLLDFVDWLPALNADECYYITLFARKKYHASAKNDKSQCKRMTATSKAWVIKKIRQLESPEGTYTNKDGSPVHNDSLALYISVNPRSFATAQRALLKRLVNVITIEYDSSARYWSNPASMAMSEIQKAKSRTCYVDFDFDGVDFWEDERFTTMVNVEACSALITRGGYHLLVSPNRVNHRFKNTWHKALSSLPECDVVGDNLIPVAGCTQGGYCPELIK